MRKYIVILFILITKAIHAITYYAGTCPGPINWGGTSTANSFNATNSIWYTAGGIQLTSQPAAGSVLVIPATCTVVINDVSCTINNNITLQINGTLKFKAGGIGILLFNNPATIYVGVGGSISNAGTNGASEITFPGGDKYQATIGVANGPFILNNGCRLVSTSPNVYSPIGCGATLLPIALLEFTGTCVTNGAQLNWSTATEINNEYFLIERSDDGYDWEQIAKVKGLVNSYTNTKYTHIDYTAKNNLAYYRLSQVDINGIKTTFKSIDLYCRDNEVKDEMILYPNPSSNGLNIMLNTSHSETNTSIILVDNVGQLIFETKVDLIKGINSFAFPIDIPSGAYTVLFSSANTTIPAQKLMVIK